MSLPTGTVIGGCRIERILGRGGMGEVYRAQQEAYGRPVALKVIIDPLAAEPDFRARFDREWRIAASIEHPNVVPVYAAGEQDGRLFLVMRYIDGADLREVLTRDGALPLDRAARLIDQVADALDEAHAK